ncbi:MAG TPA: hypothetical protein VN366_12420, partial [Feifaniaceae bacterium]|nr:hypothetical protein [Feifaniaceae bacterium]
SILSSCKEVNRKFSKEDEKMKVKSRLYWIISVLVAGIVLLTGCGAAEGEAGLSDDSGYIEEAPEFNGETGAGDAESPDEAGSGDDGYIEEVPEFDGETGAGVTESPDTEGMVTGTVKEADAATGKVIIVSEDDTEITLDVPSEALLDELAGFAEEGARITVTYNDATKTVTNVTSQADSEVIDEN